MNLFFSWYPYREKEKKEDKWKASLFLRVMKCCTAYTHVICQLLAQSMDEVVAQYLSAGIIWKSALIFKSSGCWTRSGLYRLFPYGYIVSAEESEKKNPLGSCFSSCASISLKLLHITLPTVTLMWATLAAPLYALWTEHISQETGH